MKYELKHGNCNKIMPKLKSSSFDLAFYSPPYNMDIKYDNYDDNLSPKDYIDFLMETFFNVERILKNGGHQIINIPFAMNKNYDYIPYGGLLAARIYESKSEMIFVGSKTWFKTHAASRGNPVGSIYNKPRFMNDEELILVYRKGTKDRNGLKGSQVTSEFKEDMVKSWNINPLSSERKHHPATFPYELPEKIIKWFTREGEWVIDPFCGHGTTILAAKNLERNAVGIDISEKYIKKAESRINNIKKGKSLI